MVVVEEDVCHGHIHVRLRVLGGGGDTKVATCMRDFMVLAIFASIASSSGSVRGTTK